MKRTIPILIVIVILAVGLVVYFSGKKKDSATSNTTSNTSSRMGTMPSQTQSQPNNSPQATNTVIIDNFTFSPADITVKKGTTVTWKNNDNTAHTVTETDSQNGPKSSDLAKGQSYSFTYASAGTFKYHCSIHPSMTGSVTVTD